MTKYRFHTDPGHGWLAVKVSELVRLGIADQISRYSYRRGDTAYLEEDCDASLFMATKQAAGEPVEVTVSHANRDSRIRSYDSYCKFHMHYEG